MRMHAPQPDAPASLCCQALHVVCVAEMLMHAVTNVLMSCCVHAFVASFGFTCGTTEKPVTSQTSHESCPHGVIDVSAQSPVCATGLLAPGPHVLTVVPSHAHDGMPLHAPVLTCMHVFVALQLSLTGKRHMYPLGQS